VLAPDRESGAGVRRRIRENFKEEMIMAKFEDMKAEQVEEAWAEVEELVWGKLDTVYKEVALLQRKSSPLKEDEVDAALVAAFFSYSARLAHETEQPKEEFLEEIEEAYDDLGEGDEEEEEGEATVVESTEEKPAET
jgi:hypothetical protein